MKAGMARKGAAREKLGTGHCLPMLGHGSERFMVVHVVGADMQWRLWGRMSSHMEASEEAPCWMTSCWPMTAQARQTSLCATRAHRPGASQPVSCQQAALREFTSIT